MSKPLISNSLLKAAKKLFQNESERSKFIGCFQNPQAREQSLLWLSEPKNICSVLDPFDFQPTWVQRIADYQAGQIAEHERGEFYILDSSSVFAISPMLGLPPSELIFDACAAPGGKSIFAWRAHRPKLLISNEFVEKRLKILISNIQRCQVKPVEVFHLATKRIGEMFPSCFPLVLVDSPCSGQSLPLKGERVAGAFHPQTINGNAMRQRRILAELAPSVAPGGHILYMTCTFSIEENEEIVKWFLKKFPQFEATEVPSLKQYHSMLTEHACYRLWPQQQQGAGSFTALLKNTEAGERASLPKDYKPVWRGS